jgi:integrase
MILRRKTRAGKVRYGVRIDRGGDQVWIGTFATIAEARQAEAKARLERKTTRMSCDRLAEHWLEGYRGRVKASTYSTAEAALKGFVDDFRGVPLSRLDAITAERWARSNTWRIPTIVTMMNAAVESGLIERNPFKGLSRKGPGRRDITPLTPEQVGELADAARRLHGQTIASFVTFTAYTGMRVGEVFALQWTDIDFTRNRIKVNRRVYRGELALPKSNRRREIVLPPPARDVLLPLDRSTEWVFTGKRGGQLSQSGLGYYWRGIEGAFGRKVTPHELKHFAGYYLYVVLGLPDRVVAEQLAHQDGGKLVRELYGHGDVGALEEIDQAFADNVVPLRPAQGQ